MIQYSVEILSGGQSQKIVTGPSSVQTAAIPAQGGLPAGAPVSVLVYCDVDTFVRRGTDPIANASGTDQILVGGTQYRVQMMPGEKLAFITSGSVGAAYVTPGA